MSAEKVAASLTEAQRYGVVFLAANNGLEVPNMNMAGRSKEWPTKATLDAVIIGAVEFNQLTYSWRVTLTPLGLEVRRFLQEQSR